MRLKQGSSGLPKQTSTSPAGFDPIFTHTCRDTWWDQIPSPSVGRHCLSGSKSTHRFRSLAFSGALRSVTADICFLKFPNFICSFLLFSLSLCISLPFPPPPHPVPFLPRSPLPPLRCFYMGSQEEAEVKICIRNLLNSLSWTQSSRTVF